MIPFVLQLPFLFLPYYPAVLILPSDNHPAHCFCEALLQNEIYVLQSHQLNCYYAKTKET